MIKSLIRNNEELKYTHNTVVGYDNQINEIQYFSILDRNSGVPLFTKSYDENSNMHENIVGSFITAIQMFGSEMFNSGNIKRINFDNYSMLLKNKGNLIFCLVSKDDDTLNDRFLELIDHFSHFINLQDLQIQNGNYKQYSIILKHKISIVLEKMINDPNKSHSTIVNRGVDI